MQFAIVIMAAGKGTRLKSKRPKVLHEVGGKPLLRHVVDAARQIVPPEDVYVIVGHEAGLVRDSVAKLGVQFVEQTEPGRIACESVFSVHVYDPRVAKGHVHHGRYQHTLTRDGEHGR